MNRHQLAYQYGRLANGFPEVMISATSVIPLSLAYHYFDSQPLLGSMALAAGIGVLGMNAIPLPRRVMLHRDREATANSYAYPFEHADKIVIDDRCGLEMLLSETELGRKKEWGTVVRAKNDKKTAVIYDILDCNETRNRGLVLREGASTYLLDKQRAVEQGANGHHHYHPNSFPLTFGSENYCVSIADRHSRLNWINLLTFNRPNGPEIIGYNRTYTYLPEDNTKRVLVRATPSQIMHYLS